MEYNLNNNLTFEEFGLYVTMVEMPTADYVTVDYLSALSTDGKIVTQRILDSLTDKGYLFHFNGVYAVNKAEMVKMIKR